MNASFRFTPADGGANAADDLLLIRASEAGDSQGAERNFLSLG